MRARQSVHHEKRRVPAGTSEYQAAWIIDDSEEEGEESGSEVRLDLSQLCIYHCSIQEEEGVEFDEMRGAIQPVEDDSSTEGDGESIAASEMDTDTVRMSAQRNFYFNPIYFTWLH